MMSHADIVSTELSTKEIIGKRLKQARLRTGLTLDQLAEQNELTRSRYASYETGGRAPGYDVLIQLANFLNVSPAWLCGFDRCNSFGFTTFEHTQYTFKDQTIDIPNTTNNTALSLDYLHAKNLDIRKLTAIIVHENGMANVINKGDEVIINHGQRAVTQTDIFCYTRTQPSMVQMDTA